MDRTITLDNCTFVSVSGSYKTGATALLSVLGEYEDLNVIPGEFKPLSLGLSTLTRQIAARSSIDLATVSEVEHRTLQYAPVQTPVRRMQVAGVRLLQSLLPSRFANTPALKAYSASSSFDTQKVFPNYQAATRSLFSGLKQLVESPSNNPSDQRKRLQDSFREYFSALFQGDTRGLPVLDQFVKPGSIDLAYFMPFGRFIVVARDPRDQFCDIVSRSSPKPEFRRSDRAATFIERYLERYKNEDVLLQSAPPNVLRIQFEDLVLDHDATRERVLQFLGVDSRDRQTGLHFQPEQAKSAVGLYRKHPQQYEIELIEKSLDFRLYTRRTT